MKTFGWKSISPTDWSALAIRRLSGGLEAQAINHITVHIAVIKNLIGRRSQKRSSLKWPGGFNGGTKGEHQKPKTSQAALGRIIGRKSLLIRQGFFELKLSERLERQNKSP